MPNPRQAALARAALGVVIPLHDVPIAETTAVAMAPPPADTPKELPSVAGATAVDATICGE